MAAGRSWAPYTSMLAAAWLRETPETTYRRLTGTLVSADLSGFTAMSERLAAMGREGSERLTDVVNGCFDTLISIAAVEGGDVLKFGGDALLIWFDGDVSAIHAGRAMVRMQRAIGRAKFARLGLKMSVGAHYGEFDMFMVGQPDWRELVLAGIPVTRTVDLEAAANAGEILVSAELARRLPEGWCGPVRQGQALLTVEDVPRPRRTASEETADIPAALVPPDLRDELDAITSLGGEHRLTTVAFLEVLGSDDSLLEVGPQEFVRRVDDLVRAAQRLQDTYGVQFLYTDVIANGIKLIATAGAPRSTVNDDEAALRFAVDYVRGDPLHRLKAGVNRGRVFAGFLGSDRRRAYTVMGDSVNLAARLMGHAQPGQVIASTEVIDGSRAEVRATPLPPFLVKGKTEPIKAAVVEEIGAERAAEPDALDLPLVGREPELAIFDGWLADVALRRGHAVEVIGAAGVGKSRLLAEVAGDGRLFARIIVQCQPYASSTAYAVAKVALRRALGIRFSATPEEAGEALTRLVGAVRPELVPLLPLIATAVDARVPGTPEADAIADEFVLARTHEVVIELLSVVLSTPTLIQLEDAYYADAASAALFGAIAKAIDERPWLLVAATRPGTDALLPEGADRIEIGTLGPEAAAALAAAAGVSVAGADVDLLAKRADGNPLFILRLSEAVRSGVAAEDLPESVERVIAERLDRLHPADRTLLRYASVLGPRFDADFLDTVVRRAGQVPADKATWRRLTDLVEFESDTVGRFKHLLYRDVAYEALPFRHRRTLHQQVGELLEASSQASDVALLSEHFFRAGDRERAWRYSVAAGDAAWKAMAVTEAAAAYERALRVRAGVQGLMPRETARVAEALGDVLERSGRFADADSPYRLAAKQVAMSGQDSQRLLRKRGILRERVGKYELALRWYQRGTDGYGANPALMAAAAGIHLRLGRQADALEAALLARQSALDSADRSSEAQACLVGFAASYEIGQVRPDLGDRAMELFVELGDASGEAKVLINAGAAAYYVGRWTESADHYRQAAVRSAAAGDKVYAAMARSNLAEILSDQGHLDEAITEFATAAEAFRRANYAWGAAVAGANLGRAQARAGDGEASLAALNDALVAVTNIGSASFVIETRLRITEALLLQGKTSEAAKLLDEVEPAVLEGGGLPGSDAVVARLRCWIHRQAGEAHQALIAARSASSLAEAGDARFERAIALNEVAILTGDREVEREVNKELAALGIVRLPALPVPI